MRKNRDPSCLLLRRRRRVIVSFLCCCLEFLILRFHHHHRHLLFVFFSIPYISFSHHPFILSRFSPCRVCVSSCFHSSPCFVLLVRFFFKFQSYTGQNGPAVRSSSTTSPYSSFARHCDVTVRPPGRLPMRGPVRILHRFSGDSLTRRRRSDRRHYFRWSACSRYHFYGLTYGIIRAEEAAGAQVLYTRSTKRRRRRRRNKLFFARHLLN